MISRFGCLKIRLRECAAGSNRGTSFIIGAFIDKKGQKSLINAKCDMIICLIKKFHNKYIRTSIDKMKS